MVPQCEMRGTNLRHGVYDHTMRGTNLRHGVLRRQGLVFTPLSQPYLHEYGDDWYHTSPRRLCDRALNMDKTEEGTSPTFFFFF